MRTTPQRGGGDGGGVSHTEHGVLAGPCVPRRGQPGCWPEATLCWAHHWGPHWEPGSCKCPAVSQPWLVPAGTQWCPSPALAGACKHSVAEPRRAWACLHVIRDCTRGPAHGCPDTLLCICASSTHCPDMCASDLYAVARVPTPRNIQVCGFQMLRGQSACNLPAPPVPPLSWGGVSSRAFRPQL